MTQFKVYASKDNDGQVVGATVIAYDNADKTIEKIIVLDAEEITVINNHLDEIEGVLLTKSDIDHNHNKLYYDKLYVDELESSLVEAIGNIVSFDTVIVDSLPEKGEKGVFYFKPLTSSDDPNNIYEEYMWLESSSRYECIATTSTSLSLDNYYTKEEVDSLIDIITSPEGDYYTKSEIDGLINSKSDINHKHDDLYYTESEIDGLLDGKASNALVSSVNNGLMSSADKTKLDGVEEGANKTVIDSSMSESSVNPVQNKIIYQELANKAPSSHVHSRLVPTSIPENANLNDYTTQGSFYCSPNTVSQTVTNTPYEQSFHLEVYKTIDGGVCQVAYNYHSSYIDMWRRNGYGGNWTNWYKIIDSSKIDSSLSSTSTYPVQNKVVNTALNGKANSNHTHNNYTATTTVTCNYGTVKKFKKNGWAFVVYENMNISTLSNEVWTEIADIGWSNQAGNSYTSNFQTSILDDRFRITADGKLSAMRLGDSNHQGHYGYIVYPTAD